MTLDEAVFIANRMAQVLSDSALILDKMDAQSGEPNDYRLTARHRRKEADALRMVITAATGIGIHAMQCPQCQDAALVAARTPPAAPPVPEGETPDGIARIAAERRRQISAEGWTPEHDDTHWAGDLAAAAACLAAEHTDAEWTYPYWEGSWIQALQQKHSKSDRVRQLEIAGALIAAEIDRLARSPEAAPPERPAQDETTNPKKG